MSYDPHCPHKLRCTQEWFAAVSSRPLTVGDRMQELAKQEASSWVLPSPTLQPHQRMEIYNQQYWWRLLRALRDNFPLTTRLFGSKTFDLELGVPYLDKQPPQHWSLADLGSGLPNWIELNYHGKDARLVRDAARVDWALSHAFLAAEYEAIDSQTPDLPLRTISLQPYLHLLTLRADLFAWREEMGARSEDAYVDRPFPPLNREAAGSYVVYRNKTKRVLWQRVTDPAYHLLGKFKEGSTLDAACEAVAEEHPEWENELVKNIPFWFQEWTMRGWLRTELITC